MKTMKLTPLLLSALIFSAPLALSAKSNFTPGVAWSDTSGKHINAHGCCVVYNDGAYYWFGEDRNGNTSNGVSCYKSTDLYNWTRVGLVMSTSKALDPETGKGLLERPKVVYNDKTGKWVMYCHWENGNGYGEARVCVATCDKIDGTYEFVSTFRPNNHDSRDQTIFKDKDGRAYHFGSTDMNTNMNVALLTDDYLETEKNPVTETKILKGLRYEAPAIFRVGDIYYGLFSGCTGWDPNPGHTAWATEVLGYWTPGKNFCIDNGAATSYKSQSTYVLKVEGKPDAYIYMGDRWNSSDVGGKSEYVWLPLSVRSGMPTVKWFESWDLSVFDDADRFKRISAPTDGLEVLILDKYSDRWVSTKGNGLFIDDDKAETNMRFTLESTDNPYVWRFKETATGKYLESVSGSLRISNTAEGNTIEWRLELEEDGCYRIQNTSDSKFLSVSGGAQLAGTPIFMSNDGASTAQSFGLYCDTRYSDHTPADMFSADYRAANLEAIAEQQAYEKQSGLDRLTAGNGMAVSADGSQLHIAMPYAATTAIRVFDAASGRTLISMTASLEAGDNSIAASLSAGIYLVELTDSFGSIVAKVAVR